MSDEEEIILFCCRECGLKATRPRTVPKLNGGEDWLCWDCGHLLGEHAPGGTLDLGIIRTDPPDAHNQFTVFAEEFRSLPAPQPTDFIDIPAPKEAP